MNLGPAIHVGAPMPATPVGAPALTLQGSTPAPTEPATPPFDPDSYYGSTQGKRGAKLLRELHAITARDHEVRTYSSARSMMFRVVEDLDDDDVVVDLYSGQRVPEVSGLRSATKAGLTTEHVWPQSEGATDTAKSDMHHLRPALAALNTHRSNLPFGVVKDAEWASPDVPGVDEISVVGTDASGTKVFTPRASMRGDLARDQLYFFTRYHGDRPDGYSNDNFRHSLATLLRWHREDPVDDAERARNEAIARLQGNRNPYVDRPEFVRRVGFTNRLGRSVVPD